MESLRPTPRRHVGLWILVLGGAVIAFIASQGKHTPAHAPAAASRPVPVVTHTEVIHTITTKVVQSSGLPAWAIVVIVLAAVGAGIVTITTGGRS